MLDAGPSDRSLTPTLNAQHPNARVQLARWEAQDGRLPSPSGDQSEQHLDGRHDSTGLYNLGVERIIPRDTAMYMASLYFDYVSLYTITMTS
jgi:hypothetical protein